MRVFYFNRYASIRSNVVYALTSLFSTTGNSLSIDEVQAHENSLSSPSNDASMPGRHNTNTDIESEGAERVLSFAQIQALIEAGRLDEIPYNKNISKELNVRLSQFVGSPCS